ncbi:MAG: hypothetical protein LQ345_001712 [Seirophora villosa]|nr:MAG: hypothetical protein LQ345_001712 [Seirophora villosa]
MRLGYSVLLVAYNKTLIHDDAHSNLAQRARDVSDTGLDLIEIPKVLIGQLQKRYNADLGESNPVAFTPAASDVAFYFHTSGTSSGLPKPIPQTHHAAVGVLPSLPHGQQKATLTTTPLYHGGIADCFRAWTSGALVWLFPSKDVPITTSNILKCLVSAAQAEVSKHTPPVKYFSSVPYVLQMVSSEPEGLEMLQGMDIVGVGGAALPPSAGDSLVQRGVNLVSRFGSAECGFVLSSHRDYQKDKDWQYLRNYTPDLLTFEVQKDGSGLSELVIPSHWPHMAKRNREDGSFATADLFAPHPKIANAWKYHSRADSQLTLITGKKFDPAPLEAGLAQNDYLSDVLVFGNGKQIPGALLFRSPDSKAMDAQQMLDEVWPVINRLNKDAQGHTRLSRSMLVIMDPEAPGLEKSSKGTVLRAQAEKRYEKEIQKAYERGEYAMDGEASVTKAIIPEHEIPTVVLEIIKDVIGTQDRIAEDADLFSFGVDSVACMAIRAKLQSKILGSGASQLPLNIVYDCGTIRRLSKYLLDVRHGRMIEEEDELKLMKKLVERYSQFSTTTEAASEGSGDQTQEKVIAPTLPEQDKGEHVLLTGATGALGAHILHLLRSSRSTTHITCLVRAATPLAAHERVSKSLLARGKPGLPPLSTASAPSTPSISCLPATLSHPTLALAPSTHLSLATTTTLIIHAAWAVNFTARLRSFEKDHIAGLSHLLALARTSKPQPRFLFLSSTASVSASSHLDTISERPSLNPHDASPLGYSRSKWVAERICASAQSSTTEPSPKIAILRIGQLCSDTSSGIWNTTEAWPLMLSTAPILHALPDLGAMSLDWMPVDAAAAAVLQVGDALKPAAGDAEVKVFHILNPHRGSPPTWRDLVSVIRASSSGLRIEVLPPREWLGRVEAFEGELAARKLVGVWRAGFGDGGGDGDGDGDGDGAGAGVQADGDGVGFEDKDDNGDGGAVRFEVERARKVSAVMRDLEPLSEEMMGKMWAWVAGHTGRGKVEST